jgi:c-di-GMP-binding flagellar brake protein YcgR
MPRYFEAFLFIFKIECIQYKRLKQHYQTAILSIETYRNKITYQYLRFTTKSSIFLQKSYYFIIICTHSKFCECTNNLIINLA